MAAYVLIYSGNQTGGNREITVPDGSIVAVGNVTLPGRNFNGYGNPIDQNMLSMVENFASSSTGPSNPVTGQLWYDISETKLKYNISTSNVADWASVPPLGANGNATFGNITLTGNLIVDPPGVIFGDGGGISNLNASNLTTGTIPAARLSGTYNINVNGNIGGPNTTTVTASGNVTGGNIITAGIVQAGGNVTGGNIITAGAVQAGGNVSGGNITTVGNVVAGGTISGAAISTANLIVTNKTSLGSIGNVTITGGVNGQFLQTNGAGVLTWASIAAAGLANGSSNISIPFVNGNVNTTVNGVANVFVVTSTGANILGTANVSGAITSSGNITGANLVTSGSVRTANLTTGASGTAGTITGTWVLTSGSRLQATYADLAERHHSDKPYQVGTVITVGGANEITAATRNSRVLGVVSNAYAYLMNSAAGDDDTHPPVAYLGRVPVRVIGPINKHDSIVPTLNGCAIAIASGDGFGWALETNLDDSEKLVLCIVK